MIRRRFVVGAGALAALVLGAAPASASLISVNSSELRIDGDNDADAISVSTNGTVLTVVDTGVGGATDNDPDPGDCTQVNPTTVTCVAQIPGQPPIDRFDVQLGNGIDSFVNQNFETVGGRVSSQDVVTFDTATGAKTIVGGPGDQSLDGGLDNDSIDGGEGDDRLFDGGGRDASSPTGGNDLLVGGTGDDEARYFRTSSLNISLDDAANDGQAGEADNVQVEIVTTGNGDDTITGNAGSNLLAGGPGSDLVVGLGGNDELYGEFPGAGLAGRGLIGGGGDDTLDGGAGRDALDCGRGFDLAIHDPSDGVRANCERTGAEVVGDSASVSGKKKNKFKVQILCPESEGAACAGKLKVTSSGKKVGKGKFSVANGKTKASKAKLTKKGTKALKKAGGSLLVTVTAETTEPGGVSKDAETILLHR